MKYLLFFFTLLLFFDSNAQESYRIFNSKGKEVSYENLLKATDSKSHIFFGEYHDCATIHWFQLQLTKYLFEKNGQNLVVGAEMFESDNQLLIDEYFSGKISTKNFEDECRLWTNYKTDYKPIVEFLKAKQVQLIATNIPRRYANSVFYNGLSHLETFSDIAKTYFPKLPIEIDTTLASYKELLEMSMGGHSGKNMMEAQAVKDATMAHFILLNSEGKKFLHLNGSFHTNKYEGILSFLMRAVTKENIMVITMVSQGNIDKLEEENLGLADFIFCFPEDYARSH